MVRKVKKIKVKLLLVLAVALLFLILGCTKSNTDETVSYSEYSFTDTSWTRKAEHDIETTEETVSTIKVEACDESIKLNFDGEIRVFVKEKSN
jgi:major membrane immunogen (membrane-anchored lipoprotein)